MFAIYTILSFHCNDSIVQAIYDMIASNKEYITLLQYNQSVATESYCLSHKIDLFIVYIPENIDSVITLFKQIRKQTDTQFTPIIFIGPKDEYALKLLYEVKFCDYLLYPLNNESLKRISNLIDYSYHSYNHVYELESKFIQINATKYCIKLPVCNIFFIETMKHKCIVHTSDKEIIVPLSLRKILQMVEGTTLIQSHRSFIINTKNVRQVDKTHEPWTVDFQNYDKPAFVSRTYKKVVLKFLQN